MEWRKIVVSIPLLAWLMLAPGALSQMQYQNPRGQPQYVPQVPYPYGAQEQSSHPLPQQPMYPSQSQVPVQPAPQGQQPLTYAFRPDLTNPEYGQCLQMEKQWKDLWHQYYQQYENYRRWGHADPTQVSIWQYTLTSLRQQLDQAWQAFSSRCIYFPQPRQR